MTPTTETRPFIHPAAICESAEVGDGTRIWAFAHVLAGAVIGRNCNICDRAFIEQGTRIGNGVTVKNGAMIWEGVTLEDYAFIGPGVIFTNDRYPRSRQLAEAAPRYARNDNWLVSTTVRRGASIGAGAVIICGVTIGEYASIAAGAVVTRDIPDHALAVGQPARVTGRVCRCGVPVKDTMPCPECRRRV